MKNLTVKLGLFALVVLTFSSCKPKIDADFVNSLMSSQTKITESVEALKGSSASMDSFKDLMMKQAAEMAGTESAGGAEELVGAVTSLLGGRASMLTEITGLSSKVGGLLTKYQAGGLKLKDAKSQFTGLQGTFNELLGKIGDSDKKFSDYKEKFTNIYNLYKAGSGNGK